MNKPNHTDLELLSGGNPPLDHELLQYLTVNNDWLRVMKEYCLDQVIALGGSKVKILYGDSGTGKSHFINDIRISAEERGFYSVSIDLSRTGYRLTDTVALYRALASELDLDALEQALGRILLARLGYDARQWEEHGGILSDFLCEREKADLHEARKHIRTCIHEVVNPLELDFAFRKFLHSFMEAVAEKDRDFKDVARAWIRGEKVERTHKSATKLYETLARHNARSWIYSLTEIIKLMGYKGVVLLIDQFEAILPQSESLVHYTPLRRRDCYEFLRQLIDDLDFFKTILVLVCGNKAIIEDEKNGLQSYHALWMRIQPGFEQQPRLNLYADLIDADLIYRDLISDNDMEALRAKLIELGVMDMAAEAEAKPKAPNSYSSFRQLLTKSTHGFWGV